MASHRVAQVAGIIRTIAATHAVRIPPNIAVAVTVTEVKVSGDLSYADIFVNAIEHAEAAVKFLAARKGEMRKEIARKIQAYRAPLFRFHVDSEGQKASRIDELLQSL